MYDDDCVSCLCLSFEFWNGAKGEVLETLPVQKMLFVSSPSGKWQNYS
jgi:hypothetical protein